MSRPILVWTRRSTALLLLVFLAPSLPAKNLYVSKPPEGQPPRPPDSNCSNAQPCGEIRRALELVAPGDTILVADGDYLGFTMRNTSGTAANPITIKATGDNAVVLKTTDRSVFDNRDNILITFSDYVVIDGLKSFDAPRSGMRVDTSHHVTVRNCTFGDNYKWGIFTNHSNNILIENNVTYGSADEHGIYFSNSADDPTIRYNLIYDNVANGIHMNGDLSAGGASGVVGDGVISGARVEGNIIFNNGTKGGGGINMDGVQDSVIVNNVLYENHASGIIAYQIDSGEGPRNLTIAHNTVDMAADGRYALQVSETAGNIIIRNNILSTRHPVRGVLAYGDASDGANVDSSHNIFAGNPRIAYDGWDNTETLSEWQARDPHNEISSFVSSNSALFVSPNDGNLVERDYHLKTDAPAINKGQTLADVTLDLDQEKRRGAVDIGADEVVGGSFLLSGMLLLMLED